MLRLLAVAEAVAGQVRKRLKDDAEKSFTGDGVSVSWNADGVSCVGSRTHDRVEVADQDDFMEWMVAEHPEWVQMIVVPRNPEHVKAWLADLAKAGPEGGIYPKDAGGTAPVAGDIPGLVWVRGGQFKTVSITVDGTAKRELGKLAAKSLDGGTLPADLDALFEGRQPAITAE